MPANGRWDLIRRLKVKVRKGVLSDWHGISNAWLIYQLSREQTSTKLRSPVPTAQRTYCVYSTKTNQVTQLWDIIIASYSENRTEGFNTLCGQKTELLRAFAKLRKANVSFVTSVRPYTRKSPAATGHISMKFDIWVFFENMSRKSKFQ